LLAAMKSGRNSVGIEIDSEYCRIIADRVKRENQSLFSSAKFDFLKPSNSREQSGLMVQEESKIYLTAKRHKKLRKTNKT
jgi:site-specific DNA-methyltransferase (adenine-specific)